MLYRPKYKCIDSENLPYPTVGTKVNRPSSPSVYSYNGAGISACE